MQLCVKPSHMSFLGSFLFTPCAEGKTKFYVYIHWAVKENKAYVLYQRRKLVANSRYKTWTSPFPSPIPQGEPPQGEQATLLASSHACPDLAVRHIHHGVAGWFTQLDQSWLTLEDGQRTGCEPVESSLPHWGLKLTPKFSLALKKGKALWAGWRQRSLDSEEGGSVPPWLCYSFLGDFRQVTF